MCIENTQSWKSETSHCQNYKWKILAFKCYLINTCKPETLPVAHDDMLHIVLFMIFLAENLLEAELIS